MKLGRIIIVFIVSSIVFCGCQQQNHSSPDKDHEKSTKPKQTLIIAHSKVNEQARKIESRQQDEFIDFVNPKRPPKTFQLISHYVMSPPKIDGSDNDKVWQKAKPITVLDFSSQRPIILKSIHTDKMIFVLAKFPDKAPSESHKTWGWDYEDEIYKQLKDREDVCAIKWSMVGNNVSLSLRQPMEHKADVWFWKAHRTNPAGFADDKWQALTKQKYPKTNLIVSAVGEKYYLQRSGDKGRSAYKTKIVFAYQGDILPKFVPQQPTESRSDIKAKGEWKKGYWTVEFARKLDTGHKDDIAFRGGGTYLFGISLYELTNLSALFMLNQPLYKSGDVYDRILLTIKKRS